MAVWINLASLRNCGVDHAELRGHIPGPAGGGSYSIQRNFSSIYTYLIFAVTLLFLDAPLREADGREVGVFAFASAPGILPVRPIPRRLQQAIFLFCPPLTLQPVDHEYCARQLGGI